MSINSKQKRQEKVISLLNMAIETMNLAKEVPSVTPVKAVFGSVSVLLIMIRVRPPTQLFLTSIAPSYAIRPPKIGSPSCILGGLCTGFMEQMQALALAHAIQSDETLPKSIYTGTNMYDPTLRREIEEFVQEINELRRSLPPLPEDSELALELRKDDETGESICSGYFVCHSDRCLFGLHVFDSESVLADVPGVTENTHIHLTLQIRYWSHREMFPHNREVPEVLSQGLSETYLDCLTSPNSTTIHSEPDLKLLGYIKYIKQTDRNYKFDACVAGRLSIFSTHSCYTNSYGHLPKRTYLIKTLSVFLFYAPELHLRGLDSIYTNSIISQHRCVEFITRLQSNWVEFIPYGAVLLIADMAFLTILSADPENHNRTLAQLVSYLSVITSVGSVVTGLSLLRQYRVYPEDAAEGMDNYLRSRHCNVLGLETLAILYSLPYALLLWSTISFFAGFGLEVLLFSKELWAKSPVGIVLTTTVFLIYCRVWTTLEAGVDFNLLGRIHDLKDGLVNFTRGLRGEAAETDRETVEMVIVKAIV